jgi:hypothetical protein
MKNITLAFDCLGGEGGTFGVLTVLSTFLARC